MILSALRLEVFHRASRVVFFPRLCQHIGQLVREISTCQAHGLVRANIGYRWHVQRVPPSRVVHGNERNSWLVWLAMAIHYGWWVHVKEDTSFSLTWLRDHLSPDRPVRILCAPRLAAQYQSVLSQERGEFLELGFR